MLSMIALVALVSTFVLRRSIRRDATGSNRFDPEGKLRW